jgi:3-hydroxyisobutyrate dehydrogenase-like beta-hydroxyacid dehydrogenase
MQIAFVGLGTMGMPMARNIVRGGFAVRGFDSRAQARDAFVAAGGTAAATGGASVADADVVVTMLPDDAVVREVLDGPEGLVAASRPGTIFVEMSTTSPATKQAMGAVAAARGCTLLDCPVGRTADHAVAGTLTIMAAGDAAAIERVRPMLMTMGEHLFVCGPVGAASAMKVINNALAATISGASLEALIAGSKAGLELETMFAIFRTTAAWNAALAGGLPKKALKRDYAPGFMAKLAYKDVGLAVGFAETLGTEARFARTALSLLSDALADGFGADDSPGSMLRTLESRSGTVLPTIKG